MNKCTNKYALNILLQVLYGGSLCALELALEVLVTKDLTEEKFDFLYNEVENLLHMDHPHVSSKDTSE